MPIQEKIYLILSSLFAVLIVLGNLTYQKFITMDIPFIRLFELSVGVLFYPLTFFITDLITEFYGKERANFCVLCGIIMNITTAIILTFMDYLPATSWSKLNNENFHNIFGNYKIAFLGSIIACYISQAIDIVLYLGIKKLTKGKYLWLRNAGSTAISLLIDTATVITFLTVCKILPKEQLFTLIINSYTWKLFCTICFIPLFYLCVKTIKNLLNYDNKTECLILTSN